MSDNTFPDDAKRALRGYTEQLTELVDACSAALRHDQEFFLWNARRADEVVCLILLTVHERRPVTSDPDGPDGLLTLEALYNRLNQARLEEEGDSPTSPTSPGGKDKKEKRRPRLVGQDYLNMIDQIRKNSNPGVHVRAPHRVKLDHLLDNVDRALAHLVRWLFKESEAARHLEMNDVLKLALEELQRGGREGPPPHVHVKELLARFKDKNLELAGERATRIELEGELGKASKARGSWVSAFSGGAVLGVLLTTLLFGGLVDFGRSKSSTSPAPSPDPAPQTAVAVVASPDPVAVALSCPEGMVRIEATTLHLGQPRPNRAGWPSPDPAEIAPFEVEEFCIDREAVRWGDLDGSVLDSARHGDCARKTSGLKESSPAVCVIREEAEDWCEARGARLATLAEWEAVARAKNGAAVHDGAKYEWIADMFPPAVLNRHAAPGQPGADVGMIRTRLTGAVDPEGELLWSWNKQDADNRLDSIGLRCALGG